MGIGTGTGSVSGTGTGTGSGSGNGKITTGVLQSSLSDPLTPGAPTPLPTGWPLQIQGVYIRHQQSQLRLCWLALFQCCWQSPRCASIATSKLYHGPVELRRISFDIMPSAYPASQGQALAREPAQGMAPVLAPALAQQFQRRQPTHLDA